LIGSDKVEGTAVYGADDNKIGSVQRVMIDKMSGKVAYAVVSFGGFLGMGEDYYPMPWPNLKYDTRLGGYRVGVTEDQLKGAPKYNRSTDWNWSDRANDQRVYGYYNTPLWYWPIGAPVITESPHPVWGTFLDGAVFADSWRVQFLRIAPPKETFP
jgi:PRC-barrel domain